jgi:hypothetical protein
MYMYIKLGKYKFSYELILSIVIIFLILWGHLFYSCVNKNAVREYFTGNGSSTTKGGNVGKNSNSKQSIQQNKVLLNPQPVPSLSTANKSIIQASTPALVPPTTTTTIPIIATTSATTTPTTTATTTSTVPETDITIKKSLSTKEGFTPANTNYGESSLFDSNYNKIVDTSKWINPNILGTGNILSRPPQELPLPNGELLFLDHTPFKASCCPNTFSNSMGCACMTTGQYKYMGERGGNNVPRSDF